VGSRAARKKNDRGDLQRLPPLFTVLPVVAFTVTSNKEKNAGN